MALSLRRLTLLDWAILSLLLGLTALLFLLLGRGGPGQQVMVEQDGRTLFIAPLAVERTVSLPGPHGDTVLAISGGSARILSASCPHRLCQAMGGIGGAGEVIACLPNRLLVQITGGEKEIGDYDLLSR